MLAPTIFVVGGPIEFASADKVRHCDMEIIELIEA